MRTAILSFVLLALVAGCSAAPLASPGQTAPAGTSPFAAPSSSPADAASPPGSPGSAGPAATADGTPAILPIFVSSEIVAGANRFLFSLTDADNALVAAPDVPVTLEFADLAADPTKVVATADARFIWAIEGAKGLYAADVELPRAGRWSVRFTATFPDGRREQVIADFDVAASGPTPPIGGSAIAVDTPTASSVGGDLARISTDQKPDPDFYRTSVADALAAKEPFVLVFATPAFCQTRVCGPMLETVKAVSAGYPALTFINVEPYTLTFTSGALQPEFADGQLQAAPWTEAWGLRSEPWIFVVDGSGKVTAKFEAAVGADELREAIDAVAPMSGSAEGLVVAVDQQSLTTVDSFTLRTDSGENLDFAVGTLDMAGGGFPVGHLREHMVASSRVRVDFEIVDGERVAVRLTDAE